MDWGAKQNTVKKLTDKYGVSMVIRVSTPTTAYDPVEDTDTPSNTDYTVKGVIISPDNKRENKNTSRSDNVRIILPALTLPTLSEVDFKILYGAKVWSPVNVPELRPGGDILMYIVEVK
jgi:hypothetical protein